MAEQRLPVDTAQGIRIEQRVKKEDAFPSCYADLKAEIFHSGIALRRVNGDSTEIVEIKDLFENLFTEKDLINLLMRFQIYNDKHGMVPCRRVKGQLPELVDFFSGEFHRTLRVTGKYDYDWVNGRSNTIDGSVTVYVDPDTGPTHSEIDPYNSRISRIMQHLDNMYWKRVDHAYMHYQVCHPPFGVMASAHMKSTTKIDPSENAFVDAALAGAENISIVAAADRRYNEETTATINRHFDEAVRRSEHSASTRLVTLPDGSRKPLSFMQSWAVHRVEMPVGFEPASFQAPPYVSIEEDEKSITNRIHRLLGVPVTESGSGANKLAANVATQNESLKKAVADRREHISAVFIFLYNNFLRELLVEELEDNKKALSDELYEKVPSTYMEYYRWMMEEQRLRDHAVIDKEFILDEQEQERRLIEKVEQTTNKLLLEAETEGTILDRDVVISHLMMIMRNVTEIVVTDRKLDSLDQYELVFRKSTFHDRELIIEMHTNGLISTKDASEIILINEGVDPETADMLSRSCTGISPTDAAKFELEKEKIKVQKVAAETKRKESASEGKGQKPAKKSKT